MELWGGVVWWGCVVGLCSEVVRWGCGVGLWGGVVW